MLAAPSLPSDVSLHPRPHAASAGPRCVWGSGSYHRRRPNTQAFSAPRASRACAPCCEGMKLGRTRPNGWSLGTALLESPAQDEPWASFRIWSEDGNGANQKELVDYDPTRIREKKKHSAISEWMFEPRTYVRCCPRYTAYTHEAKSKINKAPTWLASLYSTSSSTSLAQTCDISSPTLLTAKVSRRQARLCRRAGQKMMYLPRSLLQSWNCCSQAPHSDWPLCSR